MICVFMVLVDDVVMTFCALFFFFKQKTAYEMRISDWSSDVCSSDLPARRLAPPARTASARKVRAISFAQPSSRGSPWTALAAHRKAVSNWVREIGRASCRERVCQYV